MTADSLLRAVTPGDLPILFEQQRDPQAHRLAAFTAKDPNNREAYLARWMRLLGNPAVNIRTIIWQGQLAGSVLSFAQDGQREISYWLGREFWGRGLATLALAEFLRIEATRPLHARVAKDNSASLRVLHKCGFTIAGEDRGFANTRGTQVEEYILELAYLRGRIPHGL
jgi:RimJ/RimL family protein N-acetyltransferase